MDHADLILLAIASGLVIVVMAVSFSPPPFSRELTKELCEDSDGTWNECGSLCTGESPGTMCAQVCVPLCECKSSFQCPPGYYCRNSGIVKNETGVCRPFFSERNCESSEDCVQPRCLGTHAVCQDEECRIVTEQGALTRCS
jgi:hypothetical protein